VDRIGDLLRNHTSQGLVNLYDGVQQCTQESSEPVVSCERDAKWSSQGRVSGAPLPWPNGDEDDRTRFTRGESKHGYLKHYVTIRNVVWMFTRGL